MATHFAKCVANCVRMNNFGRSHVERVRTMNARFILLGLILLAGVAADSPRLVGEDIDAIVKLAREYQPEGRPIHTMVHVTLGPTKDTAYVRYSIRREGQEFVGAVLTLKKTAKGWQVESCAR